MKYEDKIYSLFSDYIKENPEIEIYTDYHDFEDIYYALYVIKDIKTPCNNTIRKKVKLSREEFYENIEEAYYENSRFEVQNYIDDFISSISSSRLKDYASSHDEVRYNLIDMVYGEVNIKYPYEEFLSQYININIFWSVKNKSGYDDVFLKFLLHSQDLYIKDHKYLKKLLNNLHCYKEFKSGLSKKDIKQLEEDYKNNVFLKSLIDEIENCYLDSPRDLCFIAEVKVDDYFKLLEDKNKKFIIKNYAMCGLVDIYNGGGSILEIQLLKDIIVNTNDIEIKVEKIDKYTVDDIYGLCSSCYKDCVVIQ